MHFYLGFHERCTNFPIESILRHLKQICFKFDPHSCLLKFRTYVLGPRDLLLPRRGSLIDPEPALEPRDAEVHRDGEVLLAVVDLADLADVEAECQVQPLSVGHCEEEE